MDNYKDKYDMVVRERDEFYEEVASILEVCSERKGIVLGCLRSTINWSKGLKGKLKDSESKKELYATRYNECSEALQAANDRIEDCPKLIYICHEGSNYEGGSSIGHFFSIESAMRWTKKRVRSTNKDVRECNKLLTPQEHPYRSTRTKGRPTFKKEPSKYYLHHLMLFLP